MTDTDTRVFRFTCNRKECKATYITDTYPDKGATADSGWPTLVCDACGPTEFFTIETIGHKR